MKLKRATYRHVEAEIYDYYKTLQAMDEFRRDIILANGRQEAYGTVVGGRYAGTSIVERRATELADSELLKEMKRITRAIEDTYARTKDVARRVIWVKYGRKCPNCYPESYHYWLIQRYGKYGKTE